MSVLIDDKTKIVVQGFTGKIGSFHASEMIKYGSNVVGGVTPGKGGQTHLELPVFNTVKEAVKETGATATILFVPPAFAADSAMEAADAGIKVCVAITDGIPSHDMIKVKRYMRRYSKKEKMTLIGPNCAGVISPGKAMLGIMPGHIYLQGEVGVVGRSGTLGYEAAQQMKNLNIGISTSVGIGGDPINGSSFKDILEKFEQDDQTKAILMIGEIGGPQEVEAGKFAKENLSKPVIAYIAGLTAPKGRVMGHAGAIVSAYGESCGRKGGAFTRKWSDNFKKSISYGRNCKINSKWKVIIYIMTIDKPKSKPLNPNFSSGPTTKRPDWSLSNLNSALLGRSHRSFECKERLKEVIDKTKKILGMPENYLLGIMPGSDTGAIESSLWNLLGQRGVDVLAWENFGKDWVIDVVEQLKINNLNVYESNYGELPNLSKVNFANDVIFTWNGTTSGVKVPNGDWIPDDREGLTICDATSAIFAMPIDYDKCDVLTWSWQKVLGGEAAHGMLALSPRAIQRLESHQPSWPIPKAFRLADNKKLIKGIFEGNTINTPSMLCVEDVLDTFDWVERIGGLKELFIRSDKSLSYISQWIDRTPWLEFMNPNEKTRSNTGITFQIKDNWFSELDETDQREAMKKITSKLAKEKRSL